MELKTYQNKLAEADLRNTKPRLIVFEILLDQGHTPIGMKELISKSKGRVDRASIYRSVDSLEKAGIIHKIYQGWKYKLELSEEFHGHHHHITCKMCGKITIIDETVHLESMLQAAAGNAGYVMTKHNLELHGICQACSKKKFQQNI